MVAISKDIAKNCYARVIPPYSKYDGEVVKIISRLGDCCVCQNFDDMLKNKPAPLFEIYEEGLNLCSNLECLAFEGIEATKEVCDFMRPSKELMDLVNDILESSIED